MMRKYFYSNKEARKLVAEYKPTENIKAEEAEDYSGLLTYTSLESLGSEQKDVLVAQLQELTEVEDLVRVPLIRTTLVNMKSPACIKAGECVHCNCPIPDKFYESDACEHGCYKEWPQ